MTDAPRPSFVDSEHVASRRLGGSRRFDREDAQIFAGLRGCKRLRLRAAYIELMLPLPGVMGDGRLLDDVEALFPGTADNHDEETCVGKSSAV